MAKGVEDTAFYRYFRLVALNEVGGSPGRFSLPVDEFHAANLERARRFPLHLLASQTHDTKRSGDVRARLCALTWVPGQWERLVRSAEIPPHIHPNDAYLVLQTVVGAWPLTRQRLDGYVEKALREGKTRSNWLEPDEGYERAVQEFAWAQHDRVRAFVELVDPIGREIALDQTLLKLTCPGVPDIYQGDERWSFNLVDPDNRRPVDWTAAPDEKQELVKAVLAERIEGEYEPLDLGEGVCAFTRGGRHLVVVRIRPEANWELPAGWRPVTRGLWAAAPRTGR
jgi:(1->4)-alpha-D-glucan 1-alpha-D-glucosylmutase